METTYILITAVAVLTTLVVILLVLLIRRTSAGGPVTLDTISNQLDKLQALGEDFSALSNLFLIPHARGGLGETLLTELLQTWLPSKAYSLQYSFRDGNRVDAVIKIGNYIVPVDAKFPMERVGEVMEKRAAEGPGKGPGKDPSSGRTAGEIRRTYLKYAEDIGRKYIRPEEGTLDFALMYIPSEKIFYNSFVLDSGDLLSECLQMGVVPVSPSALFLYLQTVAFGFKGFSLPERQKELLKTVYQLRQDFKAFLKTYSLTGNHLKNLINAYEDSISRLDKVERGMTKLEDPGAGDKDLI
jgi:DNA recombination protein RmuC